VAHGRLPRIKLQLANYGNGAINQAEAVNEIVAAKDGLHIVAVVGLGQSLVETRKAAAALSEAGIAVVSSMASADNMNQHVDGAGGYIRRFFRITPTNVDAGRAAATYVRQRGYRKVMLVQDDNPDDIYSLSLGRAFGDSYQDIHEVLTYSSPKDSGSTPRPEYMEKMFADLHARICLEEPDLVYFAGRGVDLRPFLQTLSENGQCDRPQVDILTSDDASNIVSRSLPALADSRVRLFYTSVATRGQWNGPGQEENRAKYDEFEKVFGQLGFDPEVDLLNGYAMSTHDAVLVATAAARRVPSVMTNTTNVADWIKKFDCVQPYLGVTGKIAYKTDPAVQGNPVDKAMPILRLDHDGRPVQVDLVWPSGRPFGPESCG
jgi:ABC-type branched-subunit amino acid transport system substrate-binding protein